MPQSERSRIIIEFLRWLAAKSVKKGATLTECVKVIQTDISKMGASKKTCAGYIEACAENGLISTEAFHFKITQKGKDWLKTKI